MTESLKAAGEKHARFWCSRYHDASRACDECGRCMDEARELQRQAMAAMYAEVMGEVDLDARVLIERLLDDAAPAKPVRCAKCGCIYSEHPLLYANELHAFEPQSPRCHRAHPHSEPCGPAGEGE